MQSLITRMLALFFGLFLMSAAALAAEGDPKISVPEPILKTRLKDLYKNDGTPQVLLVVHLPKDSGHTFYEVYNLTGRKLSVFQFSVWSVGNVGDISFEDVDAGWSAVKELKMNNTREFQIYEPRAVDGHADEFYPKFVIHYEVGQLKQPLKNGGKHKIEGL